MKLGIILQSNKPEHAWNTFRLGITALNSSHQVEIFLMSEGSELDAIPDTKDFDISVKVAEFKELKGKIYACGTCLKMRGKKKVMFVLFPRCLICSKWSRIRIKF